MAANYGATEPCEDDGVAQLTELRTHASGLAMRDGQAAEDAFFSAVQNARLAKNAEAYYRAMFRGGAASWNLRDTHMTDTIGSLLDYLTDRNGTPATIVVWAHNSHLGDDRVTQMGFTGEINVGQLVRERHGQDTFLIGQTTYRGTLTAANDWDEPAQPGSYETLFNEADHEAFILQLRHDSSVVPQNLLERAIGVIYRPNTERQSHYFHADLAQQFDAVIHQDYTTALTPLEPVANQDENDAAETYPTGDIPPL